MPSTEAWARCATEKASLTKMSPSAASCATKQGSLRSSPGWKRVFSIAVLDPHIEIDAHEHALAPHVGLIEGAEHVSAHCSRVRSACPSQPRLKPHSFSYLDITRTSPTKTDDLDVGLAA